MIPHFQVVHIEIIGRTICVGYIAPSTTTAIFPDKPDDNIEDFDCGARVQH